MVQINPSEGKPQVFSTATKTETGAAISNSSAKKIVIFGDLNNDGVVDRSDFDDSEIANLVESEGLMGKAWSAVMGKINELCGKQKSINLNSPEVKNYKQQMLVTDNICLNPHADAEDIAKSLQEAGISYTKQFSPDICDYDDVITYNVGDYQIKAYEGTSEIYDKSGKLVQKIICSDTRGGAPLRKLDSIKCGINIINYDEQGRITSKLDYLKSDDYALEYAAVCNYADNGERQETHYTIGIDGNWYKWE